MPNISKEITASPHAGTQLALTGDGSPTVLDFSQHALGTGESMHSTQGALAESMHVYGPAVEQGLKSASHGPLTVCIVGLGLGYLEMITAALFLRYLRQGRRLSLKICSFESNEQLQTGITNWLNGFPAPIYDQVCECIVQAIPDVTAPAIKTLLHDLLQSGQWTISGELDGNFSRQSRLLKELPEFRVILYDAYSPASSPELWDAIFLREFLHNHASPSDAVFASYASRTSLKKTLGELGFVNAGRRGFGNKRECTLAIRHDHSKD